MLFLAAFFELIYFFLFAFPERHPLNIFLNVSLLFVLFNLVTHCFITKIYQISGIFCFGGSVTKLHAAGAKKENMHRKYTLFYLVKFN